jgi:predicted nucleotide-binding protein
MVFVKPSLVSPRGEVQKKLEERIALGRSIQNRDFRNSDEIDAAGSEQKKWNNYNMEYLRRAFDNESIAQEYKSVSGWGSMFMDPSFFQLVSGFREGIGNQIVAVESILERLELIPESLTHQSKSAAVESDGEIGTDIFVVHGHDTAAKSEVARFIEKLGLTAVVLHEQPDQGQTVIEKFEKYAGQSGFAVVLLTPDDIAAPKSDPSKTQHRARQNVILELGYFCGALGRGRVCVLYKHGVEIPSDYFGVLYVEHDSAGSWQLRLAKELKQSGMNVDLNKVL